MFDRLGHRFDLTVFLRPGLHDWWRRSGRFLLGDRRRRATRRSSRRNGCIFVRLPVRDKFLITRLPGTRRQSGRLAARPMRPHIGNRVAARAERCSNANNERRRDQSPEAHLYRRSSQFAAPARSGANNKATNAFQRRPKGPNEWPGLMARLWCSCGTPASTVVPVNDCLIRTAQAARRMASA